MISAVRTTALASALAVAFVGGGQAASISYTAGSVGQVFNGGAGVTGGSEFTLFGTSNGPQTSNLTPGVSQAAGLDFYIYIADNGDAGTHQGVATGSVTINGVTRSVSDNFTWTAATGGSGLSFSGGAPVVFDLGTFDVTVTPIASRGGREVNFLETAIAAPEPASFALFGVGLAGLGMVLRTRRV